MTTVASAYEHLLSTETEGSRIPDFALGTLLVLPITLVGNLSLSVLAMAGCVALATLRRPRPEDALPWWYPTILVAMVGWVTVSMVYNDLNNYVQLGYFALWAATTLILATGRLDRLSVCRGLGLGVAIGSIAGLIGLLTGIGATGYGRRLTGLVWGDPNQAGYYIAVMGTVALLGLRKGWPRWGLLALVTVSLVLTFSRTSLVAVAVAGLWFLVRRRLSPALSIGVVGGLGYALMSLTRGLEQWGPFAERAGSDNLRERIGAMAIQAVQIQPWIGRGPGTAQVDVDGQVFFFHNAYLAVRNNGGWILLGLLLLLIALVAISLLKLPLESHHPWQEAALIALLVVAISLGEAFLRAPAAVAIGLAMRHAISPRELVAAMGDTEPDRVL